jgi:DTW domain-containing protein YfiP
LILTRETENRFLILIHPKEYKEQRTGTGHMTKKSLTRCDLAMGIDFTSDPVVNRFLADTHYSPVLLYPGRNTLKVSDLAQGLGPRKPWRFILVDGTWAWAKKMLRLSTNLHALPKLSFSGSYRSRFEFKRQPLPECLSTMETVFYLIRELEQAGLEKADPSMDGFLRPFEAMIQCQRNSQRLAPFDENLRRRPGRSP